VEPDLTKTLPVGGCNSSAGLQILQRQVALSVISRCDALQVRDHSLVLALSKEEFWSLLESNDCDTGNAHQQDQTTAANPDIAPAHVVRSRTLIRKIGVASIPRIGEQGPSESSREKWRKAPPCRKRGYHPLLVLGQVFEEDGRVEDQVASCAESSEGNEKTKDDPIR